MKQQQGFTVIELLVTLVIGTLLLFSGYQLYTYVINESGVARMQAAASSVAYQILREKSALATGPCTTPTVSAPTIPADAKLPPNAAATVTLSCPSNLPTSITKVTVTLTYGSNPLKTVTHATYVKK